MEKNHISNQLSPLDITKWYCKYDDPFVNINHRECVNKTNVVLHDVGTYFSKNFSF